MTEFILYGNVTAPQLSLETVIPALSWLPGELANYVARSSTSSWQILDTILNILLVFAGARTSALLSNLNSDYSPFINRLNDALFESGQSAFRLQVDEFYMGDFIFRENNPRFIHSHTQRLGHREVGHNLDMFAPVNIDNLDGEERLYISIYEMQTWTQVTAEVFAKRCLRSEEDMERLKKFTDDKVNIFNRVFEELRLPYKFEWFFMSLMHDHVMTVSVPPSSEWWEANWYDVALSTVGHRPHLRNIFEHHKKHWNVITTIWNFNRWNGLCMREDAHFRKRVEAVYNEVSDYISRGIPIDIDNLWLKLAKLDAEARVETVRFMKAQRSRMKSNAWKHLKRIIVGEVQYWFRRSKKSSKIVELNQGLDCTLLTEDRYWNSMIGRITRIVKYIILY